MRIAACVPGGTRSPPASTASFVHCTGSLSAMRFNTAFDLGSPHSTRFDAAMSASVISLSAF